MVMKCAPDATIRAAKHKLIFSRGGRTYMFPKGPGVVNKPIEARGEADWVQVRKLIDRLGIDPVEAQKHF